MIALLGSGPTPAGPAPAVPAFMRNYHEVLRNDLQGELTPRLAAGDREGFAECW